MRIVATESGSTYWFEKNRVKRTNNGYSKRGDDEWQKLVNDPRIEVGQPMVLMLMSLAKYGVDDWATPADDVSRFTTRHTTPVTAISELAE